MPPTGTTTTSLNVPAHLGSYKIGQGELKLGWKLLRLSCPVFPHLPFLSDFVWFCVDLYRREPRERRVRREIGGEEAQNTQNPGNGGWVLPDGHRWTQPRFVRQAREVCHFSIAVKFQRTRAYALILSLYTDCSGQGQEKNKVYFLHAGPFHRMVWLL